MSVSIYGLIDPRSGELRYIGKAIDVPRRISSHYTKARKGDVLHSRRWLAGLLAQGLKAEIAILEKVDSNDKANEAEMFWIASMRLAGANLTNRTFGGDGQSPGYRPTQEALNKQSIATKARGGWSPAHRAAHKAAFANPEVRARMSMARKGISPTRKVIEAARAANIARTYDRSQMEPAWRARGILKEEV